MIAQPTALLLAIWKYIYFAIMHDVLALSMFNFEMSEHSGKEFGKMAFLKIQENYFWWKWRTHQSKLFTLRSAGIGVDAALVVANATVWHGFACESHRGCMLFIIQFYKFSYLYTLRHHKLNTRKSIGCQRSRRMRHNSLSDINFRKFSAKNEAKKSTYENKKGSQRCKFVVCVIF